MDNYVLRSGEAGDAAGMRPLWRACFGDTEPFTRCYEERIYRPGGVELALLGEHIVSMATVIPTVLQTAAGSRIPGGYVYGVATLPDHQGRGLASRLLQRAMERRLGRDMAFLCLVPDTPELFGYYHRTMEARTAFYCREMVLDAAALESVPTLQPEPITAEQYRTIRESWLAETDHLDWDCTAIGFQEEICRLGGGGLYWFDGKGPGCAAAQYIEEDTLLLNELLAEEEDLAGCLAGLLARMPARRMMIRMPAFLGASLGGTVQPMGCMTGEGAQAGYLGLDLA